MANYNIQETINELENKSPELLWELDRDNIYQRIKELEAKYDQNFSQFLIFSISGAFEREDQAINFLVDELEMTVDAAKSAFKDLQIIVILPVLTRVSFLYLNQGNKIFSLEQEKKLAGEIFEFGIINEIKSHPALVYRLNKRLLEIFAKDESFIGELTKIISNNQEQLTGKNLTIDGRTQSGTIANWLKDFISQNGSTIFNNVVLSRYITDSPNTRLLDKEEKELLGKLLTLYRNLKFFPDSMEGESPEDWQIIPISNEEREKNELPRSPLGPPQTPEEKQAKELEKIASQYHEGSLERRAIEEEIRKLSY